MADQGNEGQAFEGSRSLETFALRSVGRRFIARAIDGLLYTVVGLGFLILALLFLSFAPGTKVSIGGNDPLPPEPPLLWIKTHTVPDVDPWAMVFFLHLAANVLLLLPALLYELPLTMTRGQTIGKLVTKIEPVRIDNGGVPGWRRSGVRWAVIYLPLLLPIIGVPIFFLIALSPLFDPQRRGWHDKIAGTVIIPSPTKLPADCSNDNTANVGRRMLGRAVDWIMYPLVGIWLLVGLVGLLGIAGLTFIDLYSSDPLNPIEPTVLRYHTWLWENGIFFIHLFLIVGPVLIFSYELPMTAVLGRTVGRYLTKTKVVRVDNGQTPGWKKAGARWAALYLPLLAFPLIGMLIFLLTALSPLFDRQRRGWHDKIAGTKVVRTTERPRTREGAVYADGNSTASG